MKNSLDASFIIINYNGKKYLNRLIKSIQNQSNSSFEIIIVDNASTDGSVEYLSGNYPNILLLMAANVGYGQGCNLGSKFANGKFLIFLNPDVYLPKNYLKKHIHFYNIKTKQYQEPLGCLGCPTIEFNANPHDLKKAGGGIIDIFGTPSESHDQKRVEDSLFSIGTGLFIKRRIFNMVKGFNPNLFLYGEEIDLCWRLKTQGYRHLINNNNYFYHFGGGSDFGKNRPRQIALMTYGCFIDTFTNFQTITLLFILPLYFLYLSVIIISLPFIKKLNFNYSKEIFIAFKRFFLDYKKIIKFRNFVQNKRTSSDFQLSRYFSLIPSILLH